MREKRNKKTAQKTGLIIAPLQQFEIRTVFRNPNVVFDYFWGGRRPRMSMCTAWRNDSGNFCVALSSPGLTETSCCLEKSLENTVPVIDSVWGLPRIEKKYILPYTTFRFTVLTCYFLHLQYLELRQWKIWNYCRGQRRFSLHACGTEPPVCCLSHLSDRGSTSTNYPRKVQ